MMGAHREAGVARRVLGELRTGRRGPLTRLPFDSPAAERHAQIRHTLLAQPIGERDLVIASTALAHGATLVTHT